MQRTRIAALIVYTTLTSGRYILGACARSPSWKLGCSDSVRLWIFYA